MTALPGDALLVVEAAAVIGRRFDWALLAAATGLADDEVLAALRAAIDAQLVVGEPDGFRFRHALTRGAVLTELLPPERARLAATAADALEAADPELLDGGCELAAELREHAGQADLATDLLHISACRALARGALITAESTLPRARELAADEQRIALDESLVEVLTLAGRTDETFAVGARVLAGLHGDVARAARTHLRLARAAYSRTSTSWDGRPAAHRHSEPNGGSAGPVERYSEPNGGYGGVEGAVPDAIVFTQWESAAVVIARAGS